MKAIKNVKDAFENSSVIITSIMQGHNKTVRIDAKTRFYKPDMDNFFSKWCSEKYANRLAVDNYGKSLSEMRAYKY